MEKFDNNKTIEIQCILHTLCNLRCKFCYQTKEKGIREDTLINVDYIKQLPDEIVASITPIMKENNIRVVKITFLGGELLSDDISDSIFDLYREFLYNVQSKLNAKIPDIRYEFLSMSNGIFRNHDRVGDFLKEFNARISLSYDPVDRFSSHYQKDVWYEAFQYLRNRGIDTYIAAVISKRNIYAYINGDPFFEKIGNNVFVELEEYSPRLDYHDYLPGDDDLFNFYKWALDNQKFNISDVNSILKHSHICQQEFYYAFGESTGISYISNCLEGLPFSKEEYYGRYDCEIEDDTDCLRCKQPLGIQKRGCLMCEYYMECSEMCWTQVLFEKYEMTTCPIQRVYKYIEENPHIQFNFQKWREMYEDKWKQKSVNSEY